jgi:hypothetical protein
MAPLVSRFGPIVTIWDALPESYCLPIFSGLGYLDELRAKDSVPSLFSFRRGCNQQPGCETALAGQMRHLPCAYRI